jgi:hypothetical protein
VVSHSAALFTDMAKGNYTREAQVRTALVLVVLALLSFWTCVGGASESVDAPRGPTTGPHRDQTVYWSQSFLQAECMSWSSEHRANPPYVCESADDFYMAAGDTITGVEWWGTDDTLNGIGEFLLRFHEPDDEERYNVPGVIVYEETILDFTVESVDGVAFRYYCDIPGGFAPASSGTYWISILGVHSGTHGGHQWFWYECVTADYWGDEGVLRSDFWGYPEWTPWSVKNYDNHHVEFAFVLYSGGDTPVERSSWAGIKAMFRTRRAPTQP